MERCPAGVCVGGQSQPGCGGNGAHDLHRAPLSHLSLVWRLWKAKLGDILLVLPNPSGLEGEGFVASDNFLIAAF